MIISAVVVAVILATLLALLFNLFRTVQHNRRFSHFSAARSVYLSELLERSKTYATKEQVTDTQRQIEEQQDLWSRAISQADRVAKVEDEVDIKVRRQG